MFFIDGLPYELPNIYKVKKLIKYMEKSKTHTKEIIHHHHYHNAKKNKVNWVLTLIMSFFFGVFGIDRFSMGHVGLGFLKLITCGGLGRWALIDFIRIAIKSDFGGSVEWE